MKMVSSVLGSTAGGKRFVSQYLWFNHRVYIEICYINIRETVKYI